MPVDCADQTKGDHRHHHHGPRPTAKNPGENKVDARQHKDQAGQRIRQKRAFLLAQPADAEIHLPFRGDARQDILAQGRRDLARAGGVIL